MRYAMIQNGVVVNIALWDGISPWEPGDFTLVNISSQLQVDIGWLYDGTNFSPPSQ